MFIFYSYLFTLEQWNAILNDLTLGLQFHLWRKFQGLENTQWHYTSYKFKSLEIFAV